MPRIHKIRVANIRYAEDSKRIPDIILDAEQDNLLLVLANGGGKSLLLQLFLQCVLPNCKMGTRRIADMLVNAKFCGHVLVEWLLDGENPNYLLTGFCFTNPSNDNKQIDCFNYTNIYDASNPYDLQHLPLVENQIPISYTSFRKFLSDTKQPRLQTFDTQKPFKDYLSQFHIYAEEWENMRVTNSDEGGVGKFFSNCKTTTQFLENIALPTIERALFENNQEREILVKSFKDHYKQMLEIPVLQKNVEDYSKISDLAEPLIQYVELHHNYQENLDIHHKKIVGLHYFLKQNIEVVKNSIDEINLKIAQYAENSKQCQWKIESYTYFKTRIEKENLNLQREKIENKLIQIQLRLQELTEEDLKFKAFGLYIDILSQRKECQRLEMRLEQLSEKSPELQKQLTQNINCFAYTWKKNHIEIEAQRSESLQSMDSCKIFIQKTEKELVLLNKNEREAFQQKAVLQNWLDAFLKKRQNFSENFNSVEAENPQIAQERLVVETQRLESKNQEFKVESENINVKFIEIQDRIQVIIKQETENLSAQNNFKQKLIAFETESENLLGQLSLHKIISVPDLLLHQNTVQLRLHSLLLKEKDELALVSGQCANVKAKISYVSESNYFVPHPLLLAIKNHLESVGISVVLGTEWLHAQGHFTETQKQTLVKKNPLLPFSFLAENSQIKSIERELLSLDDWEGDFPIVCIARDAANLSVESGTLFEQPYTIFRSETLFKVWNEEAFSAWKESLGRKLQEYTIKEVERQAHYEFLLKLETKINEFYKNYNEKLIAHWKFEIFQLQERFNNFQKEKEEIDTLKATLKIKLKEIENSLVENTKEISNLRFQQREVAEFITFFDLKDEKNSKFEQISSELSLLEEKKLDLENQLKKTQTEYYETKERVKELEVRLLEFDKVKLKYLSGKNILAEENTQEYSHLLNKIETLAESLNSQQQDIVELTKSLEKSLTYLKKDEVRLEEIFGTSTS
ncbi:MAG: hypothetical protein V4591_03925, partial [Bdellovibrionota bacterium]